MEKKEIKYVPKYFKIWDKPHSSLENSALKKSEKDQVQYKYNGMYFEKDRVSKDWSRLPDLFSEILPFEMDQLDISDLQPRDG